MISRVHTLPARAAKNGVVIATEKKAPTILIDETSLNKICMLTDSIGAVYSGMGARAHAGRACMQLPTRVHPTSP